MRTRSVAVEVAHDRLIELRLRNDAGAWGGKSYLFTMPLPMARGLRAELERAIQSAEKGAQR